MPTRRKNGKYRLYFRRNNLWDRDNPVNSPYGKKLLEKMGWTEGKGLGVNEQGIKKPLKINIKNDAKGIGFNGEKDEWTEYYHQFNKVLEDLMHDNNVIEPNESKIKKRKTKGLEDLSLNSKARIHYFKFVRAKDVSKYNEKDLECIFGKHKDNSSADESKKEDNELLTDNEELNVNSRVAGSMVDYFNHKMKIKALSNTVDSFAEGNFLPIKKEIKLEPYSFDFYENCKEESEFLETENKDDEDRNASKEIQKNTVKLIDDIADRNFEDDISKKVDTEKTKLNLKHKKIKSCSDVNDCNKINESEVIPQLKKEKRKQTKMFYDTVSAKKSEDEEHTENIEGGVILKKIKEEIIDIEYEDIINENEKIESERMTNENKDELSTFEIGTKKKKNSKLNTERNSVKMNCDKNVNSDLDLQISIKKKENKNKKKNDEMNVTLMDEVKRENLEVISEESDLTQKKRKNDNETLNDPSEVEPCKRAKRNTKKIPKTSQKASDFPESENTCGKENLKGYKTFLRYKSYKVKPKQFVGSNLTTLAGYGTIKYIK